MRSKKNIRLEKTTQPNLTKQSVRNSNTIKYLTSQEISQLFKVITNKRDNLLFKMCYLYGLRISEALNIRLDDIRLVDNRIFIRALKGGYHSESYITNDMCKQIKKYIDTQRIITTSLFLFATNRDEQMSRQHAHRLFAGYCMLAKISLEKAHPHSLRHSIAVEMAEQGQSLEQTREHLRHRSVVSTETYYKITNKAKIENQKGFLAKIKI